MLRRQFLKLAAALQTQPRPNVLIILTDDQGYGDFSCHGNPVLKTPIMDKLHDESVRFTDFHVAPMCTPTRGQLMSGVDALKNRATSVTAGRAVLRRDLPTMADIFRKAGYRTGLFGKWHLGDNYPYRPMDRGFETAKYHLGFGMSSAPEFDNDYFNGRYHEDGVVRNFTGYCTDFWFGSATSWMSAHKAEPFFCYLPLNAPHGPAWVDPKYAAPYDKPGLPKNFYGMIANLDENLGTLETWLKTSGLRDNTIVVFMTDNGATAGFNVHNSGMRGRKTMLYEGGHRVPCFVRWPAGNLRKPADVSVPAQVQDILPTILDLCGIPKPANAKFDGTSLAPVLRGKADNVGDRILIVQYGQIPKKYESTVIWNKWRLVNGTELYDLNTDPAQSTNVASANPTVATRLRRHYEQWWTPIEPTLKDFQPISIGAPQENPTLLTSSDWEEIYADNPGHVSTAAGGPRGGPWNVYIERSGQYEILLSRWPLSLQLPLSAGRNVQRLTFGELPPGKAVPIAGARLSIAGIDQKADSAPDATHVRFQVKLAAGKKTKLHGWFVDAAGADLCGAFYASVKLL